LGRPTLDDVARRAKVGEATVDRVLNGRGGVSARLAEKVIRAAKALKYGERRVALHRAVVRIEVILVRTEPGIYARLNLAFEQIAASLDKSIVVHRTVVRDDSAGLARRIAHPPFRRTGLIVMSRDHPVVTESIREVRRSGTEVVQLMTRCADPEIPYVGIDNYAAGRTAAFHISRMLEGRHGTLIALCHSGAYALHKERIRGFSDYLREHLNRLHDFPLVLLGFDQEGIVVQILEDALRQDPDIIGLYNAGAANQAVASVLQKHPRKVVWVGHALTEHTAGYLRSGVMDIAIDQAPELQARLAIDTMLRHLDLIDIPVSSRPVPFLTITAENIPEM
jgi:LacI family transcriptional regulator